MLSSLAIAAAAAGQSPMVVQAPSSPPILAVGPVVQTDRRVDTAKYILPDMTPVIALPIHVRVMAGNQELLNDTFRVTSTAGASYQESRSEAPESACVAQRYINSQERNSLNMNLYLRDGMAAGTIVNVSVSWQRASKMPGCGGEGSRQVQLNQTLPLAPGQSVTIQGDAGLAVTISR